MNKILYVFLTCIFLVRFGFSQEQSNQQTPRVIDLTQLGKTYTISARMELPQVRMFDRRITPNFKQVTAEKSFSSELSPQSEQIQYEPITSGQVKQIDNIETLLRKKRF
ncbi:MAG: hypothetical protein P8048_01885 [Calditrichia bacterium]|jgi:hypothetical protein